MSYQSVCDLCGFVIDERSPHWYLEIERKEPWEELSACIHFCRECIKKELKEKIAKFLEANPDAPCELQGFSEGTN